MVGRGLAVVAAGGWLACGRLGYDPLAGDDASIADAARGPDARGAACDWRQGPRLSAPERLDMLSLAGEDELDPVLDPDGRTVYFASTRSGDFDIFEARRPDPGAAFGAPTPSALVDVSSRDDLRLGLTADRRTAFLSSDRMGGNGGVDVWLAVRATPEDAFPPLQAASGANTNRDDHDPELSADGRELWFAPVDAAGDQAIHRALRIGDTLAFEPGQPVTELNAGPIEADPTLTADGRTIVFTSVRSGNGDLWYAVRDDPSQPFGPPMPVPDVNDPAVRDGDADLSADGCELVFASQRDSGNIQHDLYRAVFLPP